MALILRYQTPVEIERGVTQTLSADVYNGTSQQTATAATVTITQGGTTIVDGATATAGAPTTYSLADSVTTSLELSDDLLIVWTLTIGGTVYTFQQVAYLVRRAFRPVINDTDLLAYHDDLDDLNDQANYSTKIAEAETEIRQRLNRMGRRPHLVFDVTALRKVHIYETLHLIYNNWSSSVGSGKYERLAAQYRERAEQEWASVSFTYDEDEDGLVDEEDVRGASSVVFLTGRRGSY